MGSSINHDLIRKAQEKIAQMRDDPHDARNLLAVYVGLAPLGHSSQEARRRLPTVENKLRVFVETGKIPLTEGTQPVLHAHVL